MSSCHKRMVILAGVLVAAFGLAVFIAPAFAPPHHHHYSQLKDSSQVRGLHQAMVMWAQDHPSTEPPAPEPDP